MALTPFACRVGSDALEAVAVLAEETPRPPILCPLCREGLVYVTARGRTGARHRVGGNCARRPAESTAHDQTKRWLARAFAAGGTELLLLPPEEGPRRLSLIWDRTQVEVPARAQEGAPRVDVGLLRHGRVVFALEVCGTNPVHAFKALYFRNEGIPWGEIQAVSTPEQLQTWPLFLSMGGGW